MPRNPRTLQEKAHVQGRTILNCLGIVSPPETVDRPSALAEAHRQLAALHEVVSATVATERDPPGLKVATERDPPVWRAASCGALFGACGKTPAPIHLHFLHS